MAFSNSLLKLNKFKLDDGFELIERMGMNSRRCKERGFQLFCGSYIHSIEIEDDESDVTTVHAKCWRSMRKNETHTLRFTGKGTSSFTITGAYCECQAGIAGGCSHLPALFYTLSSMIIHGFKDVPTELSCTSLPQQWGKPRGAQIKPMGIMDHVLNSKAEIGRKRKPVKCTLFEARKPKGQIITDADDSHFKNTLNSHTSNLPLSYLIQPSCDNIQTAFGPVQKNSPIHYQLANYKDCNPVPLSTEQCTCIFSNLPVNACDCSFPEQSDFFRKEVEISVIRSHEINTLSMKQSESRIWFAERKLRLCSSNFKRIARRKKAVDDKFLSSLYEPRSLKNIPSIEFGKKNEKVARQKFLQENPNMHLHSAGHIINPKYPFLGTSPDGVLCTKHGLKLFEIKCLFKHREGKIGEIKDKQFFLKTDGENIVLDSKHEYYFQIQGQMLITNVHKCVLFVFSLVDSVCVEVEFNAQFCESMLEDLHCFYFLHYLPFIAKQCC